MRVVRNVQRKSKRVKQTSNGLADLADRAFLIGMQWYTNIKWKENKKKKIILSSIWRKRGNKRTCLLPSTQKHNIQ